MNASMSFKRFDRRLILVSELVFAMSSRTLTTSEGRSMDFKQLMHRFGAHACIEFIAVLFDGFQIHLVGQQLAALQRGHARIDHHEGLEVQHALDFAQASCRA